MKMIELLLQLTNLNFFIDVYKHLFFINFHICSLQQVHTQLTLPLMSIQELVELQLLEMQ